MYQYNSASNSLQLETEDSLKVFSATCKVCPLSSDHHVRSKDSLLLLYTANPPYAIMNQLKYHLLMI